MAHSTVIEELHLGCIKLLSRFLTRSTEARLIDVTRLWGVGMLNIINDYVALLSFYFSLIRMGLVFLLVGSDTTVSFRLYLH